MKVRNPSRAAEICWARSDTVKDPGGGSPGGSAGRGDSGGPRAALGQAGPRRARQLELQVRCRARTCRCPVRREALSVRGWPAGPGRLRSWSGPGPAAARSRLGPDAAARPLRLALSASGRSLAAVAGPAGPVSASLSGRLPSRTFFPAKGRGLADCNLLNAGLAKPPFQCAAKSHHRKNPANSHANAALRSEAKSRGKKILLIPVLIPGLARIRPGD